MVTIMINIKVNVKLVPNSTILVELMMETIISTETLALTRAIRFYIPEDDILHTHRLENLKFY
jgi:hypothetical protein